MFMRYSFQLWELDVGGSNPSAPTNFRPFRTPFLLKNTNENGVFCVYKGSLSQKAKIGSTVGIKPQQNISAEISKPLKYARPLGFCLNHEHP